MKRLLLACSLFTVAMTVTSVQKAQAQTVVTASSFANEIDSLNNQITRLDTVTAKATFANINSDMINVLGVTKTSIRSASSDSTRNYYINYLSVQQVPTYRQIWLLKASMVTNQTALIGKLNDFKALIY
jgi:hypothetical protein